MEKYIGKDKRPGEQFSYDNSGASGGMFRQNQNQHDECPTSKDEESKLEQKFKELSVNLPKNSKHENMSMGGSGSAGGG